jgi:hypothetical protein
LREIVDAEAEGQQAGILHLQAVVEDGDAKRRAALGVVSVRTAANDSEAARKSMASESSPGIGCSSKPSPRANRRSSPISRSPLHRRVRCHPARVREADAQASPSGLSCFGRR